MGPQLALERFVLGAIETKTTAMAGLGEEHPDDEQILFWSEKMAPSSESRFMALGSPTWQSASPLRVRFFRARAKRIPCPAYDAVSGFRFVVH